MLTCLCKLNSSMVIWSKRIYLHYPHYLFVKNVLLINVRLNSPRPIPLQSANIDIACPVVCSFKTNCKNDCSFANAINNANLSGDSRILKCFRDRVSDSLVIRFESGSLKVLNRYSISSFCFSRV